MGILAFAKEMYFIDIINKHYNELNFKMTYIPHRRDSREKISFILNELKIDVVLFDLPAEVELVNAPFLPYGIASFYSTTLLTLPKIFSFGKVNAFKLPLSDISDVYRLDLENTYAKYKEYMQIINLN